MRNRSVASRAFCVWAAVAAASGCSTVVLSENQNSNREAAIEHAALAAAASAVSQTRWPKPVAVSWSERLAGGAGRFSEDQAAEFYVAQLGAPPRKAIVLADAAFHLSAAQSLIDAAGAASHALRPMMADVAVVETAIADLRQTREIYLSCLKQLGREGENVNADEVRELKAAFSFVLEKLGTAADEIAERAELDGSKTFAGPAASRFIN